MFIKLYFVFDIFCFSSFSIFKEKQKYMCKNKCIFQFIKVQLF